MAIQEVVIRPGDSICLVLDVPGHPMRLDLSLTRNGVAVAGPVPMGAPTIYGGVRPPRQQPDEEDAGAEMVDLTEEFEAEDRASDASLPPQKVESLAAVEPFGEPQAVDIPFEDIGDETAGYAQQEPSYQQSSYEEPATVEESSSSDLDFDLSDLGDDVSVEAPQEDAAEAPAIDIPEDEGALSLDSNDEPGFSADAMTMVPPTRKAAPPAAALSLDEEEVEMDADGNPKEKFKPGPEDTLPVWTGKASSYKDPNLEKKKATAKLNKNAPGKPGTAPVGAKASPAAKLPPGKQPVKKPTGQVGPAASGKKPATAEGTGNFTVFLSPPKGADKKQAAAEIIAALQGIDMNSALALAGKMIVPVVKGVTEDEANSVRDRFKDAGLSCRITQKR
jgi:ribosomal protein L7/L12